MYTEKGGDGSVHRWDQCVGLKDQGEVDETKDVPSKPSEKVANFVPKRAQRECGDTKSGYSNPWEFNELCASKVCAFRCQPLSNCAGCGGGNCRCVEPVPTGHSVSVGVRCYLCLMCNFCLILARIDTLCLMNRAVRRWNQPGTRVLSQ